MRRFLKLLLLLAGILPIDRPCLAQNFVWTEWETKAVERRGPALSNGLLVYLHGAGPADAAKLPVLTIFTEMAKQAKWDILRVNRLSFIDVASQDDQLLQFIALHVARARQDGYRKIVVAGGSRGGWLALAASALADVDAVIGLAPGTWGLPEDLQKKRAGLPEQVLAEPKVRRIAAFFFEGDPLEASMDRAAALRQSLQRAAQSSFMVVDRPPDLHGHSAAALGRFTRRYRDCLLHFVQSDDPPAGEVQCAQSGGYAAGSDIGFTAAGRETEPPPNATLPSPLMPAGGKAAMKRAHTSSWNLSRRGRMKSSSGRAIHRSPQPPRKNHGSTNFHSSSTQTVGRYFTSIQPDRIG